MLRKQLTAFNIKLFQFLNYEYDGDPLERTLKAYDLLYHKMFCSFFLCWKKGSFTVSTQHDLAMFLETRLSEAQL